MAGSRAVVCRAGERVVRCVKRHMPVFVLSNKEVLNAVVVRGWRHG